MTIGGVTNFLPTRKLSWHQKTCRLALNKSLLPALPMSTNTSKEGGKPRIQFLVLGTRSCRSRGDSSCPPGLVSSHGKVKGKMGEKALGLNISTASYSKPITYLGGTLLLLLLIVASFTHTSNSSRKKERREKELHWWSIKNLDFFIYLPFQSQLHGRKYLFKYFCVWITPWMEWNVYGWLPLTIDNHWKPFILLQRCCWLSKGWHLMCKRPDTKLEIQVLF